MPTAIRKGSIHISLFALYENLRASSYHNARTVPTILPLRTSNWGCFSVDMPGIIKSCTISFFAGLLDCHSDQLYSYR